MTSIRLDMTMSLDGFIAGPDDHPGQELGRGGFRLFNWLDDRNQPGPNGEVYADSMATGAIIAGRRTLELAGRLHQPGRRAHAYSKVDPEYTCTAEEGTALARDPSPPGGPELRVRSPTPVPEAEPPPG